MKAVGDLATQNAFLQSQNRKLETIVAELESKRAKKKIPINKNALFADIENVKTAMDEVVAKKAEMEAGQPEIEAAQVS